MEPITLKYSEQFIKNAIFRYWRKNIGIVFPSLTLLLAVYVIYQIMDGDRSWLTGAMGVIVVIAFAVIGVSYFVHLSRSLSRLRRMKVPEGTLELGEERFKVSSDVGTSELQWSLVKQIMRFEHAWLLLFTGSEFITLPTEGMSDEAKEFILKKVKANGAKIT